jgi:hypothetical protein
MKLFRSLSYLMPSPNVQKFMESNPWLDGVYTIVPFSFKLGERHCPECKMMVGGVALLPTTADM